MIGEAGRGFGGPKNGGGETEGAIQYRDWQVHLPGSAIEVNRVSDT